jgi:hypothetical protein
MPTHPKVDVQVARAAKLAVADLERDRHLVVAVQGLVEALAPVRRERNVVPGHERRQQQQARGRHREEPQEGRHWGE